MNGDYCAGGGLIFGSADGTDDFAYNQHGAGSSEEYEPICKAEVHGTEDATAELYGKHLAYKDNTHDEQE